MTVKLSVTQCTVCCSDKNKGKLFLRLNDPTLSESGTDYFLPITVVSQIAIACTDKTTYVIEYDENLLADPGEPLTANDFILICTDAGDEYAIEQAQKVFEGDDVYIVSITETPTTPVDGIYEATLNNGAGFDVDLSTLLNAAGQNTTYDLTLGPGATEITLTGSDASVDTIDLCAIVQNCETVTTIVDNGNDTFTYTNEAGVQVIISAGVGPQGPQGIQGIQGPPGPAGPGGGSGPIGSWLFGLYMATPVDYVPAEGGTIGNAASGATVLADATAQDLFEHLWGNLADAQAPVSGGRGATATDDFNANKTIGLPDAAGKFPFMQSAAGTGSVLGDSFGTIDLTVSIPSHFHGKGDIEITSSGAHTTALDHDHPATATSSAGSHSHTGSALAAGSHNHRMKQRETGASGTARDISVGEGAVSWDVDANTSTVADHTHTLSISTASSHTHTLDLPNFVGNSSSTGDHVHGNADFSGSVGDTGGVDGDVAMVSGSANPPGFVLRAFIKYQ